MKKIFLTLVLAVSAVSLSNAQVSFGPKLGLGISTMKDTKVSTGNSSQAYSSIITPQVGVVLNIQMGNIFALRPELLYLQRGGKVSLSGGTTSIVRVSYIELPINLAAGLQAGPGRFEVFAGPSFGFALGGTVKDKYSNVSYYGVTSQTYSVKTGKVPASGGSGGNYYVNPLNVSLNFGLDYKFDFGLLIQVGYNLGLSNTNPHYTDSNDEANRSKDVTKASAVNISVAYLFGGK